MSEIEEETISSSDDLFEITGGGETDGSLFSYDIHHHHHHHGDEESDDDMVYVAVMGKNAEDSSKDALTWTLNHVVRSTTTLYLIHIFPELHYIPTPLGKLPISQVNREQKNNHMVQERMKRSQFLQKFLDLCSASKVKVETILIESDMEAKAIVELIPILNIKFLVVGTTKSSLRRLKAGKESGIAEQIQKSAPDFCQVKMICEGKQVSKEELDSYFNICADDHNSLGISNNNSNAIRSHGPENQQQEEEVHHPIVKEKHLADSFTCGCFKPKAIS